jgi:hypothetical protein
MNKIRLVISDSDFVFLHQPWFDSIVKPYFDIVDESKNYNFKTDDIFVTNCIGNNNWYAKYIEQGARLLIDNLWENKISKPSGYSIICKNWFWYNESLWYRNLGYNNYVRKSQISKKGLLLMHLKKPHRDFLFQNLNLNELIYSYIAEGKQLENDIEYSSGEWQRNFNCEWYDQTVFSVVAETITDNRQQLFVTEKTFKPLAFRHPFIVCGQTGILKYLRSLGFETFENMFDETYDSIDDNNVRFKKIVSEINNNKCAGHDKITLEKIKHNKELFFDERYVTDKIKREIIEPIFEYAET